MKAPYPYFGAKSRAASLVWDAFGDVNNYVEPFAGSIAVLLARPHVPNIETVNDADCFIANFWRALRDDPEAVALYADQPVNECDLEARHRWLVTQEAFRERMKNDPDYHDAKIAGYWVWGISCWIGSGWCANITDGSDGVDEDGKTGTGDLSGVKVYCKRPHLLLDGMGVHRKSLHPTGETGTGDLSGVKVYCQIPHLLNYGKGVHQKSLHPTGETTTGDLSGVKVPRKIPHVGDAGRGVHRQSLHPTGKTSGMPRSAALLSYLYELAERLRRVRVCCGDWARVTGPSVTTQNGITGMFIDPPYILSARAAGLYGVDADVNPAVREWCAANGNDPKLRIALCGYEGDGGSDALLPLGWREVAWKASGGYGAQSDGRGRENAHKERILFSPHCLHPHMSGLFGEGDDE